MVWGRGNLPTRKRMVLESERIKATDPGIREGLPGPSMVNYLN